MYRQNDDIQSSQQTMRHFQPPTTSSPIHFLLIFHPATIAQNNPILNTKQCLNLHFLSMIAPKYLISQYDTQPPLPIYLTNTSILKNEQKKTQNFHTK